MTRLLSLDEPPTAIFAAADFLALTALKVARGAGRTVPSDLSIVVFDDNPLVRGTQPPLTAVSQPNWRLGEEAAGMLIARIADPAAPPAQRLIIPTFVVRESTAPAQTAAA
jgi:LacI family transcriptional regulator